MEVASGLSPRLNSVAVHGEKNGDNDGPDLENFELESDEHTLRSDHYVQPMSALEILRETVRIFRYNLNGFLSISVVLICPVSAVVLSNVLVNKSLVKRLTIRLLLVAKSIGISLTPFITQSCRKFSETAVATAMCFPLFITLLLLSKAAVVYSVDCTYSRKEFDSSKFYVLSLKIWKRIVVTYLWACGLISGCLLLFIALMVMVSSVFAVMGFSSDLILYPAIIVGVIFSVILANSIIICNVAIVISVLDDVSGPQALLRSSSLVKGQTHVGLWIFLGSTIGMVFVEGLFDHRVKTLSYGDGSSRIWEGPLLVGMYSFVVLIDSMMNTVFYFSCKCYHIENPDEENEPILETVTSSPESTDIQ